MNAVSLRGLFGRASCSTESLELYPSKPGSPNARSDQSPRQTEETRVCTFTHPHQPHPLSRQGLEIRGVRCRRCGIGQTVRLVHHEVSLTVSLSVSNRKKKEEQDIWTDVKDELCELVDEPIGRSSVGRGWNGGQWKMGSESVRFSC